MNVRLLCYFLLWTGCFSALAGDAQKAAGNNMLYSRSSELSVKNINKAAEVLSDPLAAIKGKTKSLKDPTQGSQNFIKALKNSQGINNKIDGPAQTNAPLPAVRLLGKVYHPKDSRELLTGKLSSDPVWRSSVILQVDSTIIPLHEGDSSSIIKNNQIYTIEVKAITPYSVTLILNPGQQQLVLH